MSRKVIKKPSEKEETPVPNSSVVKDPSQKERESYIASLKKQGILGDIQKKINIIGTGSWVINRLIGDGSQKGLPGGIPRGFITEICGEESTGKSTLALNIAKQVMLGNEPVLYADFEHSLRLQQSYVKNIGIDINSPNFVHIVPNDLQEGVNNIGKGLVKLRPAAIIIDSVAAMMPKETAEGEADEISAIGRHARLVGSFISWISKKLQKYDCALILINQMRANIKSSQYDPGPSQISTGGNALQYYNGVKIKLKKTSNKEEVTEKSIITGVEEKKRISQEVKVIIEKNKMDMPWRSGPVFIMFGQGIDNIMSLITLGINKGVIKKSAGYLTWKDPNDEHSFNINGKLALKKHFIENPKALDAIQPYLMLSRDDNEMEEALKELETLGVDNLTQDQKEQLKQIREIKGLSTDDIDLSDDQKSDLEELEGFGSSGDK
jgi:recombination protein RecA